MVVNVFGVGCKCGNQIYGGNFVIFNFVGYPLITYESNYKCYCCNQCSCQNTKDFDIPIEVVPDTTNIYDVAGRIRLLQDIKDSFNLGESPQKQVTQD